MYGYNVVFMSIPQQHDFFAPNADIIKRSA